MNDIINEWIQKFTPLFRYDSEEKYFPVKLEDYFEHCELWYKSPSVKKTLVYRGGNGLDLLHSHFNGETPNNIGYAHDTECNSNFYLQYFGEKECEMDESVPCYAYTTNTVLFVDILYFLPFAYSGEIAPMKIGTHDLDISHIVCRVSLAGQLNAVYFSYHNGGHWVSAPDLERVGHRPVVYVARWSHGLYPRAFDKVKRYYGLANDKANGRGRTGQHTAVAVAKDRINKEHVLLHYSGKIYKGGQGMPFFRGWAWKQTKGLEDKADTGTERVFKCCA